MSGRILAFDYGTKYIGVAVTDPLQISTRPLSRILNNPDSLNSKIISVVNEFRPSIIIIGYPTNNHKNYIHEQINTFHSKISHLFSTITINLVNEAFSSQIAESLLDEISFKKVRSEKDRKKRKEVLDSKAAQITLYQYLQNLNKILKP